MVHICLCMCTCMHNIAAQDDMSKLSKGVCGQQPKPQGGRRSDSGPILFAIVDSGRGSNFATCMYFSICSM